MKTISIAISLLAVTLILFGTASLVDINSIRGLGAQIISSQQQDIFKKCINEFSEEKISTFKITKTKINTDSIDDAIVAYTGGKQCGTAGCVMELCISNNEGTFNHVPFGLAAKNVSTDEATNNNMHDLQLNNNKETTMTWNGTNYVLSSN